MILVYRFLVLVAGVFLVIYATATLGDALEDRVTDNLTVELHIENTVAVVPPPPAQ